MPINWKKPLRLETLLAPLLVAFMAAGCASQIPQAYPPQAATSQGRDVSGLYDIVFYLAVAIFAVVEAAIIYAVLRYRRKPTDTDLPPQTHGNNLVEVIWTVIPTVIVVFLFVVSWQTLNAVEVKSDHPGVRVRANAVRFAWSFVYLGDDATTSLIKKADGSAGEVFGTMVVPVGEPIHVTLHSSDVIHAFYVPKFLFKRDVNPGPKENNFDFTVDPQDVGQTFAGQCAELCGAGHQGMTFQVKAVSRADYDKWLDEQIATAKQTAPPPPSGSPGASGQPPASGQPGASGQPAGAPPLEITAQSIQFDKKDLEAPADKPFAIKFTNNDNAVQHNIEIKTPDSSAVAFEGDLVTGPKTVTYNVPALKAGSYPFMCTVHPTMTGTLTVK